VSRAASQYGPSGGGGGRSVTEDGVGLVRRSRPATPLLAPASRSGSHSSALGGPDVGRISAGYSLGYIASPSTAQVGATRLGGMDWGV
jgi:hypothetical protein